MTLREAICSLTDAGLTGITAAKVHYAIERGLIPRPRLDSSLRFDFSRRDIRALRRHFERRSLMTTSVEKVTS